MTPAPPRAGLGRLGEVTAPTQLEISIGGHPLSPAVLAAVTEVQVRAALGMPAQAQLTVRLDAVAGSEPAAPGHGDALRVAVAGHRDPLFAGEVTVVEHEFRADSGRLLVVRGYDPLHRLRKRQSTRLHEDTDLAALATALVAGTGLSVDAPAEPLGDVYQCGVSDLELLLDRAARVGRHPVVEDHTLRLVTLDPPAALLEVGYGRTLHSATIERSAEPAYAQVGTTGWDPATASAGHADAGSSSASPAVSGPPALAAAGGGGPRVRADDPTRDPAGSGAHTLGALAQAHLDTLTAARVTASFTCDGNPAIRAGRSVRVSGLGDDLDGTYLVTSCLHRVDAQGFVTEVDTRPPTGPRPRARDQLTLGEVTDVRDPQGCGRVIVRLPAYQPLQTSWAAVLTAGAGPDKGVVALPAVGDTVLVALLAGDPAHPIVLGGLYGNHRHPAAPGDSPGAEIVLRTATGQQITVDGTRSTLTLTDGQSVLELAPDLLRISSATDVLVEAVGKGLRFRARSVDFEEAP